MKQPTSYPEIRIKNSWLLYENASVHLHKLWAEKGEELATSDEVDVIVAGYQNAWRPYEAKIVQGMTEITGLTFRQNIIDVNIAPWFNAISDPMVIGVAYKPDRFVEVLTHEIIHRLLTDNVETPYDTKYLDQWKMLFGDSHTFVTLVHIPVHAILQAIFDDVLKEPERTKNDRNKCQKWLEYDAAWRYVEKRGYREIIEVLKENYKELGAT